MIQCKKIQKLIKADYFDQEASLKTKKLVKSHLARCRRCSQLEKELQLQRKIFQKTKQVTPPQHLWTNIHNAITQESREKENCLISKFFARLQNLTLVPKPVFALATSLSLLIIFTFVFNNIVEQRKKLNQEAMAESILLYGFETENQYIYDLGTDIEKYFL